MIRTLDDGEWIYFRDMGGFLVDEQGVIKKELMEDLLHPTAAGYVEWGKALSPVIEELLEG